MLGIFVSGLIYAFAEEPSRFALDPVFVSHLEAEPAFQEKAEQLRTTLEAAVAEQFIVIDRQDVPPFEDYSAEVYLQSCPKQEIIGCSYVIGERAQADWVITGSVEAGERAPKLTIVYLSIRDYRAVFRFSVEVPLEDEPVISKKITDLLRQLVAGAQSVKDVRGEIDSPEAQSDIADRQRVLVAEMLSGMDSELAAMESSYERFELKPPKWTPKDLAQYQQREEQTPWDHLGISPKAYLQLQNSGWSLDQWWERRQGRAGQWVFTFGLGGGVGPWQADFDARWVLDSQTFEPIEIDIFQEKQQESTFFGRLAMGIGILPWLQIDIGMRIQSQTFAWTFYSEREGDVSLPKLPQVHRMAAVVPEFDLRFFPFPTWRVRPTVQGGIAYWRSKSVDKISVMPEFIDPAPAPWALMLRGGVGAEVECNRYLTVFAEGTAGIPVAGSSLYQAHSGEQQLVNRGSPNATREFQAEAWAGVRIRPLRLWKRPLPSTLTTEDEPEF